MIELKSSTDIDGIYRCCQLAAITTREIGGLIGKGITTMEIDRFAESFIRQHKGVPAFKGYHGFPGNICTSVNEVVVHGIPSDRILKEGDIVGIDVGVFMDGFYGDVASTFKIGTVSEVAEKLMAVTESALYKAIEFAKEQYRLSDVSYAVQKYVEANGFSVVREFVGHGIGRNMHEEPQVPNFGKPNSGPKLRRGMVLAIEPMVNAGKSKVVIKEDKWTAVTEDGSLSAHFEHTVAITEQGNKILTEL